MGLNDRLKAQAQAEGVSLSRLMKERYPNSDGASRPQQLLGISRELLSSVVAYYKGDGNEVDSWNKRNGVLQGTGTTYTEGPYGGRIWDLDGNGWISIPPLSDLLPDSRKFTIIVHFRNDGGDQFVFSRNDTLNARIVLGRASGRIAAHVVDEANAGDAVIGPTLASGASYWAALTADGDIVRGYIGLSVDGVYEYGSAAQGGAAVPTTHGAIGARPISDTTSDQRHIGPIGEASIFNRALSLTEIRAWAAGTQGVHYA